jgi:hypothetical protein
VRLRQGRYLPYTNLGAQLPEAEHRMLLQQLRPSLPEQPPPKIPATLARKRSRQALPAW